MVNSVGLYVLTALSIDESGIVTSKNVGATFDVFEAESHKAKGIENDFETLTIQGNWQEEAEQSRLIGAMRVLRDMVAEMQEAALR
jgi:hypothetical protein